MLIKHSQLYSDNIVLEGRRKELILRLCLTFDSSARYHRQKEND